MTHALSKLGMIRKPIIAHKCIKVFYMINSITATCFNHSCGHSHGGVLRRVEVKRYYKSLWINAQM